MRSPCRSLKAKETQAEVRRVFKAVVECGVA